MAAASELEAARWKVKAEKLKGLPPRMIFSEAVLTPDQDMRLDEVFRGSGLSKSQVPKLRKAAATHTMLSTDHLSLLDHQPLLQPSVEKRPWWLPVVCACRAAFGRTALKFGRGEDEQWYKFLFAKQSPYMATFSPLKLEDQYVGLLREGAEGEDVCSELCQWEYAFSCDRMEVRLASELGLGDDCEVFVLHSIVDRGDLLLADGPVLNLAQWVAGLPELQKMGRQQGVTSDSSQRKPAGSEEWAKMMTEYPCLADPAPSAAASSRRPLATPAASSSSHGEAGAGDTEMESEAADAEDVEELADDVVDRVFRELEKQREDWGVRYGEDQMADFKSGLLGGAGTYKAASVVCDFVCSEASTSQARAFCTLYGLKFSKRTSITLYDGVANATTLVSEWAQKMQFYLDVYRRSGDSRYVFTVDDHSSYEEREEFKALVATDKKYLTVANAIRSVMPFYPK